MNLEASRKSLWTDDNDAVGRRCETESRMGFVSSAWVGRLGFLSSVDGLRRVTTVGRCRRSFPRWPRWNMVLEEEVDPGIVEGTDLVIRKYPSPCLRASNAEVEVFDDNLAKTARDMLKVMYASRGVGLAAPQVGVNLRLMVFNPEGNSTAWVHETILANPKIVASSPAQDVEEEACLSFPGLSGKVARSKWVKVSAQRLNGKPFTVKYTGWKARIFQHEYDHLDGIVYVDRLDEPERQRVDPMLQTLIENYTGPEPPAL